MVSSCSDVSSHLGFFAKNKNNFKKSFSEPPLDCSISCHATKEHSEHELPTGNNPGYFNKDRIDVLIQTPSEPCRDVSLSLIPSLRHQHNAQKEYKVKR